MKKIIMPPLTCLIVVSFWMMAHKRLDNVGAVPEEFEAATKTRPLPLPVEVVDAIRAPSGEKITKVSAPVVEKKFEKRKVETSEENFRDFPGLPEDLKLADHIYSINARDFAPNMGEIISSDDKNVIFRADIRPTRANFMAVDPANNRMYPIAPSVKLANVSDQVRNALLNEGFIEKYYNEDLKVMFVESDEKNVFEAYASLTGLKLEAELEVIRGYNRPR